MGFEKYKYKSEVCKMIKLLNIIKALLQQKKGRSIMTTTQEQQKKSSYVSYVYGQIFAGFLKSNKGTMFKVTNIRVREWKRILGWLKKNEYIVDFKLGDTIETACELTVEGFNTEKTMYPNYLKAIEENIAKEMQAEAKPKRKRTPKKAA